MEAVKWIEPIFGELGQCRIRLTRESAWDDKGWRIVDWASQRRPIIVRDDG